MSVLRKTCILLIVTLAWGSLGAISATATAQDEGSATLTVHWRECEQEPANGDWYGECHDDPSALTAAGLFDVMVFEDTNERFSQPLDADSNVVFRLPPGTYSIEGGPGEFVRETHVLCSSANNLGVDIGYPVTLATGGDVVCDYYLVPANYSALPATEPAPPEETPVDGASGNPSSAQSGSDSGAPATDGDTTDNQTSADTEQSSESEEAYSAGIYAAGCDADDWGEPVGVLNAAPVPSGNTVGSDDAMPVAVSSSTIELSIDDLLTEEHVLVVFAEDGATIACGALGGVPEDNGALAIGLGEVDGSGIAGVAYLAPAETPETATNVSMFLVDEMSEDVATPAAE